VDKKNLAYPTRNVFVDQRLLEEIAVSLEAMARASRNFSQPALSEYCKVILGDQGHLY
jgi:hypothetical protein